MTRIERFLSFDAIGSGKFFLSSTKVADFCDQNKVSEPLVAK